MNIFALDESPWWAARYHNDRHVVKMILETAQLLCTAHVQLDGERVAQKRIGELILRPTHVNHPCAIWVRKAKLNYEWLHALGMCLLIEYRNRYGKQHAYEELFARLEKPPMLIEHLSMRTPWPQCMPTKYQRPDPVEAYRLYYFNEKRHLANWRSPASVPQWWSKLEDRYSLTAKKAV